MFERATRECSTSPMIATFNPAIRPLCSRIVSASSKAWVGCSCEPSPALTIAALDARARCCGAPADEWRMTMQSGAIASRFRAVSNSVSPFETLEVETLILTASADKRLAAISNEVRVRVDGSKKRLMTVRPRRAGTFLISSFETSRNVSAVSIKCVILATDSSRIPSRCFKLKLALKVVSEHKKAAFRAALACRFRCRPIHDDDPFVLVKLGQHHFYDLTLFGRHQLADVIRLNRQLAMFVAAVDQHGQLHTSWSSEIDQLVDRRAHRATGVKHVVD